MILAGKVVLITGGTRMGAALAHACAVGGADIALSYSLSGSVMAGIVRIVEGSGRRGVALHADLRDPVDCQSLVNDVVAWAGRIDVLVCLASVYERVPVDALTPDAWRHQLAVDLDASFHCARAAAAHMQTQGAGHIVLCSDWVAASGRPRYTGYIPYFVAKAGIVALTEALALELAPHHIQVNAIAPGPILPAAGSTAEAQAAVMQATPLGHWGGPEALSHAVMALLEQEWVTGQVVRVDGGRHLK
jgi:NAD(P)-dependent dehydrogenase (short-subunit alcohol dehydrogenase family)